MFEPELFRKQIHCIEESTCEIFGTFRHPRSDSAPHIDSVPGELGPPCPPRYVPGWSVKQEKKAVLQLT